MYKLVVVALLVAAASAAPHAYVYNSGYPYVYSYPHVVGSSSVVGTPVVGSSVVSPVYSSVVKVQQHSAGSKVDSAAAKVQVPAAHSSVVNYNADQAHAGHVQVPVHTYVVPQYYAGGYSYYV